MGNRPFFPSSVCIVLLLLVMVAVPPRCWPSSSEVRLSKGQTVYVPAYSNVFSGPKNRPFRLAATLSIRNPDLAAAFRVTAIDYYDTSGKLVRRYLEKPLVVAPLASTYVHVPESDASGGFGASFIVRWDAEKVINAPVIECVMIGATSGQGISFISPGREIRE